jgi:hypothetical protein
MARQLSVLRLAFALVAIFASGCAVAGGRASSTQGPLPTISPSPFQSLNPTATANPVFLWVDPNLPSDLDTAAAGLENLGGRTVEKTSDSAAADLRFGPAPEAPVSQWIYALVGPFPTIADGLTLDELKTAWSGQGGGPILATPSTADALAGLLGPPTGVQLASEDAIVD